jgi:RecA-family ATPase
MARHAPKLPTTISLGELQARVFPPREYLVNPWLRQGEAAMIWAAPGVGKTWFALTMALMAAGGGSALGWSNETPRRVLYADGEMAIEDLKERTALLMGAVDGIDREAAWANLHFMSRTAQGADVAFPDIGERGNPGDGQERLMEAVKRHKAELLVLDNFSTLAEVDDENAAASFGPVMGFLLDLKQARVACLFIHHSGKTGIDYRGSSRMATTFEIVLGLTKPEGAQRSNSASFTLGWGKYRAAPHASIGDHDVKLTTADGGLRWCISASPDEDVRRFVAEVKKGVHENQREIAKALGMDPSKLSRKVVPRAEATGALPAQEFKRWLEVAKKANTDHDVGPDGGPLEF